MTRAQEFGDPISVAKRPSRARPLGAVVATLFAALIAVALCAPLAHGASTHPFVEDWEPGTNCNPRDVATDATGNVYVACAAVGANERLGSLRKFSPTGVPITFAAASEPYISGNEINEAPLGTHLGRTYIDVDRSNSIRSGYIYVTSYQGGTPGTGNVEIFAPSGAYVTSIKPEVQDGRPTGVGIDDQGFIYVMFEACCGRSHIKKINPENFQEIARIKITITPLPLNTLFHGPCCVRVDPDSSGAVWAEWGNAFFDGATEVGKYEADQFPESLTKDVEPSPYLEEAFPEIECPKAEQNGFGGGEHECALQGETFDVEWGSDDLYLAQGDRVSPYSKGEPGDPVHQNSPSFGEGDLNGALGIDVDKDGNVYVGSQPNTIVKYAHGATLPTIVTKPPTQADTGHTEAIVRGTIDPDGGGAITSCQVKFGTDRNFTHPDSPVACDQLTPLPGGSTSEVTATLPNLTVGQIYYYRFEASNANGSNFGGVRRVEAKAVLSLETLPPTNVDENNAVFNGQLDADNLPTTYYYEYGRTKGYGQTTAPTPITGAPGEIKSTPQAVGHLQRGKTFHYRLVATNSLGTTKGEDVEFRTASPPEIAGVGSENVLETSADLHAAINPVGFETTYQFLYGPTPEFGSSLPVSQVKLNGNTPQKVSVSPTDLPAGRTIFFKVVATNEWGTTETDVTSFNFRPPSCPNAHVRQLTSSSYLPDCRAYEIVTPGYAGAVQILPGEALETFAETFGGSEFPQSPQNLGYANGQFVYWAALGSVQGQQAPNSLLDVYMASRTVDGWKTSLPGLKGNETKYSWGRSCSHALEECVDHIGANFVANPETGEFETVPRSQAPFLYKADGTKLGRLPTNVDVVKGGTRFRGDQRLSGDFSHFIFSTQTQFAPDGLTSAPGSVYDNAIGPKTVKVISRLNNEEHIPAQPSVAGDPTRVTGIAGVSRNGSRVLLAGTTNEFCDSDVFPFRCPWILKDPARLYMRVSNAMTYDVSRGEEVNFVGTTLDLDKVYFTTTADLDEAADNDTSRDLYLWEEQGDKLTLVSQNGALGAGDDCSASWTQQCGILPLTPRKHQWSEYFDKRAMVPGTDDVLGNLSGDIYFYSPEDLVPGEIGGDGERNLYLYKDGELQYVTTFDPGTEIERSTISQNGTNAAFMTKSSLTAFDAGGRRQVYMHNAATNAVRCASCNPSGAVPVADVVTVSESGNFMANDGRTFFATTESLVPQDTNGIRDVYEYTEGRAHLITSGTADRDNTGGLEVVSFFFGKLNTGLEAVSRDGVDVYFSTFETLVPEDQNGSFLKIYDARGSGGFDFNPDLGDCLAADECHGDVTRAAAAPEIATGATFPESGNVKAPARTPAKKCKKGKVKRKGKCVKKRAGKRNGKKGNGRNG